MRDEIPKALQNGDFSKVQSSYEYRFWLAESVLVIGSPTTSATEFVDSRGSGVEEVAIRVSSFGIVRIYQFETRAEMRKRCGGLRFFVFVVRPKDADRIRVQVV